MVVASPTYKASYTGMLKAFLDRYGNRSLASVVAVPVMTGAAPQHAMTPDVHLRPLLVELGASVPTSAPYFPIDRLDQLDAIVESWAKRTHRFWRPYGTAPRHAHDVHGSRQPR